MGINKANNCPDRQQVRHPFFFKQRQFHQHSGMHVIMCHNLTSKEHTLLVQSGTAADFPSRLELKVTEKICLKIRQDIQTTSIEMPTSSSDVADEEQFSSHKQPITRSQKNKPLNGKNNRDKMRTIGSK